MQNNDGFIMNFWERVFYFLSKISLFDFIWSNFSKNIKKPYTFVECWVVGHTFFALTVSILLCYFTIPKLCVYFIIYYGVARVFEILIYQLNVILFDPYRAFKAGKTYKVKSVTRMLILIIHNYFEIIFWYTSILLGLLHLNNLPIIESWSTYAKSSFLCFATFNSEVVLQHGKFLSSLTFAETVSGIILTVISVARCINNLPAVEEIKTS